MQRVLRTVVVGVAVVLGGTLAAACGSSSANSPGAGSGGGTTTPAPQGGGGAAIKTAQTSLGTVLTTASGMTVYHLTADPMNGTACTGSCAALWPPVIVSSASSIAPGMSGFGTIQRPGGGLQATYHGEALYTYKGDTSPGQTNGQGLPQQPTGTWYVVTVSPASSGSTSTTAPSGGGGGSTSTTAGGGGWG